MMIPFDRVPQLAEDAKAVDALAALSGSEAHRGLVVENGRLAGLFSISNLARARSRSVGGPPRRRGSPRSGR
jgi:CBS domain-containing protein